MKRSLVMLTFVFALSYFLLSFCIPGWQVKLDAPPIVVFLENLKILWPVKILMEGAISTVVSVISFRIYKMFHVEPKGDCYDR